MGTQQSQGAEGAALDSSSWHLQNLCTLFHAEFLTEAQAEYLALLKAEVRQSFEQVSLAFLAFHPDLRVVLVDERLLQFCRKIDMPVVRALLVVKGQVASDLIEPG